MAPTIREAYDRALAAATEDGGYAPASPYGTDPDDYGPVIALAAVISEAESDGLGDEGVSDETLDHMAGLVVNGHDDPGYLIREYGGPYLAALGMTVADLLDDEENGD